MPLSSLRHWKDVYGIRASVRSLSNWPDLLFGVAGPFLLFTLADRIKIKTRVRELAWTSLIFISLISVHAWFAPGSLSFNKSNLLFEMIRQPYRIWRTQSDYQAQYLYFQKNIDQLRPVNNSLYKRSSSDRHPLQAIPLIKTETTDNRSRPNVVLVLMESFRAFESGAYGANPSHTPQLDKIASEGIKFTKFYGNGSYTIRGEFSTLFSFLPDFYGTDAYTSYPTNG
jgi:glucan phosphoethanolaminetransferase (alkaline phosphatase superfamily)